MVDEGLKERADSKRELLRTRMELGFADGFREEGFWSGGLRLTVGFEPAKVVELGGGTEGLEPAGSVPGFPIECFTLCWLC